MIRRRHLWRSPVSYSAEAQAVIDAFTTPPTFAREQQIAFLVQALQGSGAWALIDVLYVLAAADSQAALINWKDPGTLTATAVNSPTFTADRGFTFDGATNYLDTGYDPSVASLGMGLDDAHAGAFALTNGSSTAIADIGSNNQRIRLRVRSGNLAAIILNSNTGLSSNAGTPNVPTHGMGIRRTSAGQFYFADGLQRTSDSVASVAIASNITIGVTGLAGTPSYSDRELGVSHVGRAFSDAQALSAASAIRQYMQAVGAA